MVTGLLYFNSSMVQLKGMKEIICLPVLTYFNSSMVQLKDDDGNVYTGFTYISIPLWYN